MELGGQGFGDVLLPVGDGDGLVEAAEGLLDDELVFTPTEQEADGWLIVGMAQEVVHGGAVKIELADIAGLEGAGLQLKHDVAAHTQVEQLRNSLFRNWAVWERRSEKAHGEQVPRG